jgi:hypothetical protein
MPPRNQQSTPKSDKLAENLRRLLATSEDDVLTCEECEDILYEYVYAIRYPEEQVTPDPDVERHLNMCPACYEDYLWLMEAAEDIEFPTAEDVSAAPPLDLSFLEDVSPDRVIADIQHQLNGYVLDTRQTYEQQGDVVRVLVEPTEASEDSVDVAISIQPLSGSIKQFPPVQVFVDSIDSPTTHYGRLHADGHMLFRDLMPGTYRVTIAPAAEQWWQRAATTFRDRLQTLIRLPPVQLQPVPSMSTEEHIHEKDYWNEDGTLIVTLWKRSTGQRELDFTATRREWDGHVVVFGWSSQPGENLDVGNSRVLGAVLTWDDIAETCGSAVNLGMTEEQIHFELPKTPQAPEQLNIAEINIAESISRAGTRGSREAWAQLLDSDSGISSDIRNAIAAALEKDNDES